MWQWDGKPTRLLSRATDETGYVQPSLAEYKKVRGAGTDYHFNAIRAWDVTADGSVFFGVARMSARIRIDARVAGTIFTALSLAACNSSGSAAGGGAKVEKPATPAAWPQTYALGHAASADSIALLDTDVDTTGAGLPDGHGTAAEGATVYAAKCAGCHGAKGEGIPPSPVLIQPLVATDSFPWAKKAGAPKTVGNYWPFATTLYGYIRHSMPSTSPGSLSSTEVSR